MKRAELKPCPSCGRVPRLCYVCGEFFVVGKSDCPLCGEFKEMHATEEQETEAWNRKVFYEIF